MQELQGIAAQMEQQGHTAVGYYSFIKAFEQDIRLPAADDMAVEEALAKARSSILSLPGWTNEKLDMFNVYLQVYYVSEELGKPVYQFAFSQKKSSSKEYFDKSWEYYEARYLNPLYAQFGGDNLTTPYFVSVRLDARTGEPIEKPFVEYPPVESFELGLIK
jgi:hypothetical protein